MNKTDNSSTSRQIRRFRNSSMETLKDTLAVEEPLEIRLGYTDPLKGRIHRSVSITMRTPGADQALATGFLFTESIIQNTDDILSIDQRSENVIRLELTDKAEFDPIRLDRHFYTTSSCGVCGKASLEALSLSGQDAILDNNFVISRETLLSLGQALNQSQSLFTATGGCHATASFNSKGEITCITEDVGRHNAMDKLVGIQLSKNQIPMSTQGIIVSGRASFELMQKALVAGCPMLVAVGAPSSLAVELAEEFNISLIGFLDRGRYNLYHSGNSALEKQLA